MSTKRDAETALEEVVSEEEWLSFEYSGHTLYLHPPTKRVCTRPDGVQIGEFDPEKGEVTLTATDAEAECAETLERCSKADAVILRYPGWSQEYANRRLLCFGGSSEAVLREGLLETVQGEFALFFATGGFSGAHQQAASTRTDKIMYLDLGEGDAKPEEVIESTPAPPGCLEAVRFLEGLAAALDGEHKLGLLRPRRCMISCYEAGGFYVTHRDNSRDSQSGLMKNNRALTAILYVNDQHWPAENGGALRCYVGSALDDNVGSTATEVVDVLPAGGRVVLFDSKQVLHEVRSSTRRRFALSVWFVASTEDECLKP
eukprot:gnl/TRDRNA2_/TRDRNA2_142751_c1_seq2.p1 gnl/TRDRNA2_/TRDRNA2_142751_c1~~gnl/TRDRNA2_/TRDRNA2_142751_c1_seq2.p1  ORF type:complete len:316 (-),score=29.36 gnl/TRDRNA2_/TRDRNA2_142751_c1_seq2:140-1087(-)